MMSKRFIVPLIAFCLLNLTQSVYADDVVTVVIKKQEEKEKSRWTLWDWIKTKETMRWQDMWLAAHTSSPYEYFIGGNFQFNQYFAGRTYNPWEIFIGGYSSIIGLEARYESSELSVRVHGILNFRFFGRHDQGPNLTLQAGILHTDQGFDTYRNGFLGATLTFYFSRFFGLLGLYRHYFPSTANISGVSYFGDRASVGLFIDFRFLRIYGEYFVDTGSAPAARGSVLGTKIYF